MADWATAAIAVITGSAGILGARLQAGIAAKAAGLGLAAAREADYRTRIEELFELVEKLESNSQINMTSALVAAHSKEKVTPVAIETGRIRAYCALYFPQLLEHVERLDGKSQEAMKDLRDLLEKTGPEAVAVLAHVRLSAAVVAFAAEMRKSLIPIATEAGRMTRDSVNGSTAAAKIQPSWWSSLFGIPK